MKKVLALFLAQSLLVATAPANAATTTAAPSILGAAAMMQISAEVAVEYKSLNEAAKKAAAEIDSRLRAEMNKLKKDGVFLGITGTYKPSSEVTYLGTRPLAVKRNGKTVGAIAVYYRVQARVKLDAGTGPFTRKIAAVETKQLLRIEAVPVIEKGKLTVQLRATIVEATATKERQARQAQADKLRDGVKERLTKEVNKILSESQVLPKAVRDFDTVNSVIIEDSRFVVKVGERASGHAADKASAKAKAAPSL